MLRLTGSLRLRASSKTLRIPDESMCRIRSAIQRSCIAVSSQNGARRGIRLAAMWPMIQIGRGDEPDAAGSAIVSQAVENKRLALIRLAALEIGGRLHRISRNALCYSSVGRQVPQGNCGVVGLPRLGRKDCRGENNLVPPAYNKRGGQAVLPVPRTSTTTSATMPKAAGQVGRPRGCLFLHRTARKDLSSTRLIHGAEQRSGRHLL